MQNIKWALEVRLCDMNAFGAFFVGGQSLAIEFAALADLLTKRSIEIWNAAIDDRTQVVQGLEVSHPGHVVHLDDGFQTKQ